MSDNLEALEIARAKLLKQFKVYGNFSLRFAIIFAFIAFIGKFIFLFSNNASNFPLEDAFLQSILFSMGFSILGFGIGLYIGKVLQDKYHKKIETITEEKRKLLKDQISIRQARLESLI